MLKNRAIDLSMRSPMEGAKVPTRGHQHWLGSTGRLVGRWRLHRAFLGRTRKMEADWKGEGTPEKGSDYVQGRVRGPTGAAGEGRRGSDSDY